MLLAVFLLPALLGCASKAQLETFLNEILNPIWQGEITEACVSALAGSAGFFTYTGGRRGAAHRPVAGAGEGQWQRFSGLAEAVGQWDQDWRGVGAAMTVLDNKDCLRDLSSEAERLLWGEAPGLYYVSNTRKVVIALYDGAPRLGLIMVQAR